MFEKSISKDDINLLPLCKFDGKIIVAISPDSIKEVSEKLAKAKVIGFDTEKKPAFKKGEYYPASWVQLAVENEAYLIRLKGPLDKGLISVFENPDILKIGVAVGDDIKELQKFSHFTPNSFIDLGNVARAIGVKNFGLRSLGALILNLRISKREQKSDWGKEQLTDSQKMYAAIDAWACLRIYNRLKEWEYI